MDAAPTEDWAERVRDSFARQPAMALIGARLGALAPGAVEIELPVEKRLAQQHGYVHGGVVAMIADSAAGYSAYSVVPASASVLTVEYKINFLAPAAGRLLRAHGRVLKPGRTLVIVKVDVLSEGDGEPRLCATMLQTVMVMHGRSDEPRGPDHVATGTRA